MHMPDTATIGKWIMIGGATLIVIGAAVWGAGRLGLPLGRLPGDIRIEREDFTFYFPLATMILLSIGLTVLANILLRLFRR